MRAGDDFAAARAILADCRRDGAPFPVAWRRAHGALPPIEGRTVEAVERKQARDALLSTRAAWEAGYHRRPLRTDELTARAGARMRRQDARPRGVSRIAPYGRQIGGATARAAWCCALTWAVSGCSRQLGAR